MQVPAQNSRPSIFTCTRPGEENSNCQFFQGKTSMDSRTPTIVNEVQSFPLDESHGINEISSSSYRNNNSNNHGKNTYSNKPWQQKNDSKPWQNKDNKQWQNRDNKPWQNKDKKEMAKQ